MSINYCMYLVATNYVIISCYIAYIIRIIGFGKTYYITLKIIKEIVRGAVKYYPAHAAFIVIQRCKLIVFPSFTKDSDSFQSVAVLYSVDCLSSTNPSGIVCIDGVVKLFKLSSFLPCEGMSEEVYRITLLIIGYRLVVN